MSGSRVAGASAVASLALLPDHRDLDGVQHNREVALHRVRRFAHTLAETGTQISRFCCSSVVYLLLVVSLLLLLLFFFGGGES